MISSFLANGGAEALHDAILGFALIFGYFRLVMAIIQKLYE
jgi:hypothetical protein